MLKEVCIEAGVSDSLNGGTIIDNDIFIEKAIKTKTKAYSGRHQRALESLASGLSSSSTLHLPYYLVRILLENGFEYVSAGISREALEAKIIKIHHKSDEVKTANITAMLNTLAEVQSKKDINPPIIAYDNNTRLLQVVDSTFNFFMKNAPLKAILKEISDPLKN